MQHSNIDGRAVAERMFGEIRSDVAALKKEHWPPRLVSIKVGDDPPDGSRPYPAAWAR